MARYAWRPYVPVSVRRQRRSREMEKLRKKGKNIQPVETNGRKIARTFWGEAWCEHLEKFSDYENRLPRGRTYVRNGSVCHLEISKGRIDALVYGSELYKIKVDIKVLPKKRWNQIKKQSTGKIGSLLELLQGRLSEHVMAVVTDRDKGLFPSPEEISLRCDCPDWAYLCKHVAAVLYGVGARLDQKPELLFLLRGVDHEELIEADVETGMLEAGARRSRRGPRRLDAGELADVFGIELDETGPGKTARTGRSKSASRPAPSGKHHRNAVKSKSTRQKSTPRKSRKPAAKETRGSRSSRSIKTSSVRRLRSKFGMSRFEFAMLLGVSTATVYNWETSDTPLKLQRKTRDAWEAVKDLSKKDAWRVFEDS